MSEERIEAEAGEQKPEKKRRYGIVLKLGAVLLGMCALAAGLLWLLAWISFHMRFSAEVVRVGILGLYIVPCLAGGCVAKKWGFQPALAWGAGLGAAFYGVLFALSWIAGGMKPVESIAVTAPILCAASGLLGGLAGRRRKKDASTFQ